MYSENVEFRSERVWASRKPSKWIATDNRNPAEEVSYKFSVPLPSTDFKERNVLAKGTDYQIDEFKKTDQIRQPRQLISEWKTFS